MYKNKKPREIGAFFTGGSMKRYFFLGVLFFGNCLATERVVKEAQQYLQRLERLRDEPQETLANNWTFADGGAVIGLPFYPGFDEQPAGQEIVSGVGINLKSNSAIHDHPNGLRIQVMSNGVKKAIHPSGKEEKFYTDGSKREKSVGGKIIYLDENGNSQKIKIRVMVCFHAVKRRVIEKLRR